MGLSPGTRLGPYEITAPLGAGGMGEVYRARDTDLKRDVAIKVLPAGVSSDPERLARFKREAEILATLNHPHVAQVYGLTGTPDGAPAMVMELVDGETLAEMIGRGPIDRPHAVDVAVQIAEGLEAAHEAGVVHRDLKPANIKVRPDGIVKVLDFGLARSTWAASGRDLTNSPTVTSPVATHPGMILGTAAYMSPEQARGQVADARSDIWAFGCVLFEMLTGRRAFAGDTIADVTAAILEREPVWTGMPASAGAGMMRVLRRCLEKDRKKRYGAIADLRLDLLDTSSPAGTPVQPRRPTWALLTAAGGGAALAAVAALAMRPTPSPLPADRLTASTVLATQGQLNLGHGGLAFAPDGRALYLEVMAPDRADTQVWRRDLAQDAAVPVRGTEGGRGPSLSPDGRWLAFTAGGKLLKVPAEGGAPTVLADAPHLHGATWSRDGSQIFYAPTSSSAIWRVPSAGGAPAPVTVLNRQGGDIAHEWPVVSPAGRLVYVRNGQTRPFDDSDVVSLDLTTRTSTTLVRNALAPRFDDAGHIFFLDRNGSVSVAKMNDRGEPSNVATISGLRPWVISGTAAYDVGPDGLLAFAPEVDRSQRQIVAVDAQGRIEEWSPKRSFVALAATLDGERLAANTVGGILLVGSAARRDWTQLPQTAFTPPLLWAPDGQRLVYSRSLGRLAALQPSGGAAETVASAPDSANLTPLTWHPSSGRLVFRMGGALWTATGDPVTSEALTSFAGLSVVHAAAEPRQRLVAIATDFTGVSVRPWDSPEPTVRVSNDGIALEPVWSADGRRLYYSVGRVIEVADIETSPLSVGQKRTTGIADKVTSSGNSRTFAVLPDGRIVYIREGDAQPRDRLFIRQDWRSLLPQADTAPR